MEINYGIPKYQNKQFLVRFLRGSNALAPDILRSKREREPNTIGHVINERIVDNFWHNQRDFYLYSTLLGNTVDGMPSTMYYCSVLSGGVYQLVYGITCVLFMLPITRLEFFYGEYTKLTNSQMYRMAPIFYGFCMVVLIANVLHAPLLMFDVSFILLAAIINLIHPSMIKTCPPDAASCYDVLERGKINATCYKVYSGMMCEGYDGVVRYLGLYRIWEFGLNIRGDGNWELMLVTIITWVIVIIFLFAGMRFMGSFLLISFVIYMIISCILFVMAIIVNGGTKCLHEILTINLDNVKFGDLLMAMAFSTFKLGLIKPLGLMTYSAFVIKWKFNTGITTLFIKPIHWLLNLWNMAGIYSAAGVIAHEMGVECSAVLPHGPAMYAAVFAEFLTYSDSPLILITLYHISHWSMEISKMSIHLHMLILNINDLQPRLARFKNYVIPVVGIYGIFIAMFLSIRIFMQKVIPMLSISQMYVEQFLLITVEVILLFYCYGANRVCDDIHYITGKRPLKIWFAYSLICPILSFILTYYTVVIQINNSIISDSIVSYEYTLYFRIAIILIDLAIMIILSLVYAVVHLKKKKPFVNLVKPQFYFGPPSTVARIGRKHFLPHVSLRSQFVQKRLIRYRVNSVRVLHRVDELSNQKQGRIFMENDPQMFEKPGSSQGDYKCEVKYKIKWFSHLKE